MLQALACSFSKKETLTQVLSCEFCKISKNAFLTEYLRWLLLKGWSDFQAKGEREREIYKEYDGCRQKQYYNILH